MRTRTTISETGKKTDSKAPLRGRKRSKQVDESILNATREVLLESGYVGFTIQAVVERSGVSTATIYRRWSTANDLILAAMESLVPDITPIDTGSFENDLSRFIDYLAAAMTNMEEHAKADKKDSRLDPSLRRAIADMFIGPRMQLLADIIERAKLRGELSKSVEVERCWPYVAGPLHLHLIIESKPYNRRYAAEFKAVIAASLNTLASR
ncbi:TetR/AcrR family transcriptional regulator [Halioxenophilus sp. WMMB6]|uniref:TetR/AcrR family transcriptional regulator n=1 Tax=Halioxenophilus sp. WMMB6 TaxID=3073815 RepID=UPI00295F33A8|nr:TetR/AcrR family transcriptional regulator [Halioxenophilus sp. WMMB6]